MMVIAVGLSCYNIALFHLVNHAFYKALLFLGAGSVIHAVSDNQDFRKYGGLRPFLPLTYSVILIASLSLVAFPFMTGFYSKDLILESAYGQFNFSSTAVYFIATIGAMFTTLYSVKVLYLTFLTNPNGPLANYKNAHEGDIFMSLPLMTLAIFSIFFGFITKDMFIGLGSGFFSDNALFIHPYNEILLDTEFGVPTLFKLLPLIFTISLSVLAIVLSEYLPTKLIYFKLSRVGYNIFSFFNQRLLIELFYNRFITGVVLKLGGQTTKVLDKGSVEYIGPFGLEKGFLNISKTISDFNTGVITTYALYTLTSLILYMFSSVYLNGAIFILILFTSLSLVLRASSNNDSVVLSSGLGSNSHNSVVLCSGIGISSVRVENSVTPECKPSVDTENIVTTECNSSVDIENRVNLEWDNLFDIENKISMEWDYLPTGLIILILVGLAIVGFINLLSSYNNTNKYKTGADANNNNASNHRCRHSIIDRKQCMRRD
jgi:NADH-ubiquinone oxidoreductase chain 5